MHPYDVGDTLLLDGDNHLVDEIHLNFSACVNSSGQRVWVPTQRLANATFVNLTASGNKSETLRLFVDLDTPAAAIEAAQAAARGVVAAMPADLASATASLRPPAPGPESALPLKVCLVVAFEHTHPGVDLARCNRARTAVYVAVARALVASGVKYSAEFRGGAGRRRRRRRRQARERRRAPAGARGAGRRARCLLFSFSLSLSSSPSPTPVMPDVSRPHHSRHEILERSTTTRVAKLRRTTTRGGARDATRSPTPRATA